MVESVPKGYKPWIAASVVVLVGSLLGLGAVMTLAFVRYSEGPGPLWLVALGVGAALGVGLGFAGLFSLMVVAGLRARRVQVLPPERKV